MDSNQPPVIKTVVRPGEYRDSVALMLLARDLEAEPGVMAVSVVMATPANKAELERSGLLTDAAQAAASNDLLIVVKAQDDAAARGAMNQAQRLIAEKSSPAESSGAGRPKTVRAAVRAAPDAKLAVISVPGPYAAAQAWDALRAGLDVLLFSDHVDVQDEIALKEYARGHGLLLMGPGAGTAVLHGIGLGFANAVPRGGIGIVAAAGTGLQEVSTIIAKAGAGLSQAIGVGGRDVSQAVGGIMLLESLKRLQADSDTRVIVIVSKMPAATVVQKMLAQAASSDKPTVMALMGAGQELAQPGSKAEIASDLEEAARLAVALSSGASAESARAELAKRDRVLAAKGRALRQKLKARQRYLRGLYSGGTLCEETIRIWQSAHGGIWSNAPLDPRFRLPNSNKSKAHSVIDLGEEEFTIGRPHPMIDLSPRVERLLQEARDPSVAAIVLDVVIGYGAHPDPAAQLAPAIRQAKQHAAGKGRELFIITSVTGTDRDPQDLARQIDALKKGGAIVMSSNAAAARLASRLVR